MTGYGRAVETVNGREFTVEIRSVNNRYLDCSVKLPRIVSFAEDAVKQAVKAAVSRGKVDVFISVKSEAAEDITVSLNKAVLEGYLAAMRQMVSEFGVRDDISVSAVSQLPEVFTVEKPEADEEQLLLVGGYDHNFVIDGWKDNGEMVHAATAFSRQSGRQMDV